MWRKSIRWRKGRGRKRRRREEEEKRRRRWEKCEVTQEEDQDSRGPGESREHCIQGAKLKQRYMRIFMHIYECIFKYTHFELFNHLRMSKHLVTTIMISKGTWWTAVLIRAVSAVKPSIAFEMRINACAIRTLKLRQR